MEGIKIGLTKGRLAEGAIELLTKAGIDCSPLEEKGRRLVFDLEDGRFQVILLKAADVPTYVEHGVVDIGIVGRDVLLEEEKQLYEVLDLKFGKCKLAVAGKTHLQENFNKHLRVATKYPNIAKGYFASKGQSVEIIKQEGSVELAPLMGLTDVIVDIVETGKTLRANGLVVLEEITDITARLVVNRVSYKTKNEGLLKLISAIEKVTI